MSNLERMQQINKALNLFNNTLPVFTEDLWRWRITDEDPENFQWYDTVIPRPSVDYLDYLLELEQIQNKRLSEYPAIGQLADAVYWQSQGDESKMDEYLAAVSAVKEKYPKPVEP